MCNICNQTEEALQDGVLPKSILWPLAKAVERRQAGLEEISEDSERVALQVEKKTQIYVYCKA